MRGLMSYKIHGFMKNIISYNFDRFTEYDSHVTWHATKSMVEGKIR